MINSRIEIESGIVYRIDEGDNYRSKMFHDFEDKLVTELEARLVDSNVIVEGMVYKQQFDGTLIEIDKNVKLTIGNNLLNVVELVPTSEGLCEVNLMLENTTLKNVPEFSFSDGIVTSVWRYEP